MPDLVFAHAVADEFDQQWGEWIGRAPSEDPRPDLGSFASRAQTPEDLINLCAHLLAIDIERRIEILEEPTFEEYLSLLRPLLVNFYQDLEEADRGEAKPSLEHFLNRTLKELIPKFDPDPELNARTHIGGFAFQKKLGHGAYGVVCKAYAQNLDKYYAVKMLKKVNDYQAKSRFIREARILASLDHANIVKVTDIGRTLNGRYFLVMEYVQGETLAERIRSAGFSFAQAARVVETVAKAVHFANEKGIIHRDLKPGNIILTHADKPMLTDFGLARRVGTEPHLDSEQFILGTANYMAPEQVHPKHGQIDPRTDVHGLGAVLYELLVGTPPYPGSVYEEVLARITSDEPPQRPSSAKSDVPSSLEEICLKCLHKKQEGRFRCASDVQMALQIWMENGKWDEGQAILVLPSYAPELPAERSQGDDLSLGSAIDTCHDVLKQLRLNQEAIKQNRKTGPSLYCRRPSGLFTMMNLSRPTTI
jgi:serine/threonine-protein kinase